MKLIDIEDYKKLNVEAIKIEKNKKAWVFRRNGRIYDMAPADVVKSSLSPTVFGANKVIDAGFKIKGIKDADSFYLLFSQEYFPKADVELIFSEIKYDGWIYNIKGLNIKVPEVVTSIWICPYLGTHYKETPKHLFLRMEEDED